jgi:hypothetical protein
MLAAFLVVVFLPPFFTGLFFIVVSPLLIFKDAGAPKM